ncbi:unnamed protein product [Prunus armeniaca]
MVEHLHKHALVGNDVVDQLSKFNQIKLGGGYGVSVWTDDEDALMKTVNEETFCRDGLM